jgi:hypothetical protein
MGVTIHYAGQLRDPRRIEELLAFVENSSNQLGWPFEVTRDEADGRPMGFVVRPHPDCEPLEIEFGSRYRFSNWVKTQFAGPDIHIEVVRFLRQIKSIIGRLGVRDEGEYWSTESLEALNWHIDQINELIAEMAAERPGTRTMVKEPTGRIVDLIQ